MTGHEQDRWGARRADLPTACSVVPWNRSAEMIAEMVLTGEMLIGARSVRGTEGLIHAVNPPP